METPAHRQLKRVAIALLVREGFNAVAAEVRTPVMRYRADVAGYLDRAPDPNWLNHLPEDQRPAGPPALFDPPADPRAPTRPRTVIIECKAARADLLRETDELDTLRAELERLETMRRDYEHNVLKRREPHLRQSGEFLFGQMERWAFSDSGSPEYRRLIERIEKIENRLHGSTKLGRLRRYRTADRLFVLTPAGLVRPHELPEGWGLLECPRPTARRVSGDIADLAAKPVRVARPAPDLHTNTRLRRRLLRNIAVANTRRLLEEEASDAAAAQPPSAPAG